MSGPSASEVLIASLGWPTSTGDVLDDVVLMEDFPGGTVGMGGLSFGVARDRRIVAALSGLAAIAALTTSCQSAREESPAADSSSAGGPTSSSDASAEPVAVISSLGSRTRSVPISTQLRLTAEGGAFASVRVRAKGAALRGKLSADKAAWVATDRLEPGTRYEVTTVARDSAGVESRTRSSFNTQELDLSMQTYPSVAPLAGETVGVGMPVIVTFDIPIKNKAAFESHMSVTSSPRQPGSWHWLNDREVHWRPDRYWQAGTDVTVDIDINSIPAGAGVFGQESRRVTFRVGDAVISKVNAQTHQMQTFINGKLARTIPITTGKPGFTTRSGVKVIIEKFRMKQMNSETIGIAQDAPEGYNIDDVEYAMRVTYSGEFLHAAPWSVGSQGYANVSHGCTGMSTANAAWIYSVSKRGDVVEYTGTDRGMSLENGFGDWNLSVADYRSGSALD
ncbi:MAG: Ig-like domain-containing protein [Nocardioides sp.]